MNWIRLSDQLPPVGEVVLIWYTDSKYKEDVETAKRITENGWVISKFWKVFTNEEINNSISHWSHIEEPK